MQYHQRGQDEIDVEPTSTRNNLLLLRKKDRKCLTEAQIFRKNDVIAIKFTEKEPRL